MDDTQRIDNLEIKITYLEDILDTLNSVILSQNESIDFLKKEIKFLKEQDANAQEIRPNEKPPHY
jgi:SlyX protein